MKGSGMAFWAVLIVSAICSCLSFSVAFLAFRAGDDGAALFAGLGLLFTVLFVIAGIRAAANRIAFFRSLEDKIPGEPEPTSFVPHWFVMTAVIVTGTVILAAILIPILFG
jgi:hypothetical protein